MKTANVDTTSKKSVSTIVKDMSAQMGVFIGVVVGMWGWEWGWGWWF